MSRAHFLIATLLSIHLCVPGVAARAQEGAAAVVEFPVEVPLERSLSKAIESSIPGIHDAERAWTERDGWGIKYRIERDGVRVSIQGTTIRVSIDVRYRLEIARRIRKPWPPRGYVWASLGSCGHGEPMRRVTVDFESTLSLGQDWNVRSSSRVLGTRHHDRCRITIADISITSLIDEKLQRNLRDMAGKLDQHIQARLALRSRAESLWKRIAEPLQIGDGWMVLNLEHVSITPPLLTETAVSTGLRIHMRPVCFIGSSPPEPSTKLPPLGQHRDGGASGFQGDVRVVLPFETVKAWLSKGIELDDQDPLLVSESTITVNAGTVRLVAKLLDPELMVVIEVEPRLDPAAGTLSFGKVTVHVEDYDSPLREPFEAQVRADIQSFSYSLDKYRQALLDKTWYLGEGAQRLGIRVATLDFRDLQVTPEAIILVTSATVRIDVAPVLPGPDAAPP